MEFVDTIFIEGHTDSVSLPLVILMVIGVCLQIVP